MNAERRRAVLVVAALALIAVFVVGAIELATNNNGTPEAEEVVNQPISEEPAAQEVSDGPADGSTEEGGQTSSAATGPSTAAVDSDELPRTGSSTLVASVATSAMAFSGLAYVRSCKQLSSSALRK